MSVDSDAVNKRGISAGSGNVGTHEWCLWIQMPWINEEFQQAQVMLEHMSDVCGFSKMSLTFCFMICTQRSVGFDRECISELSMVCRFQSRLKRLIWGSRTTCRMCSAELTRRCCAALSSRYDSLEWVWFTRAGYNGCDILERVVRSGFD